MGCHFVETSSHITYYHPGVRGVLVLQRLDAG